MNGRLTIGLIIFALTAALTGLGGAIRSYAQQQVLDQRVGQLEEHQEDADAVKTKVTELTTEFKGFKNQYAKDQERTDSQLETIIGRLPR